MVTKSITSADLIQVLLGREDVGVDVRLSEDFKSTYRDIRGYRSDARGVERSNLDSGENHSALLHWDNVYSGCVDLMRSGGLDFELMAWLCEALLRKEGYLGLAIGFELITAAINKFQMTIFPSLDEDDDSESKVRALTGLNGESSPGSLISPLYQVKIGQDSSIGIWSYQRSIELDQVQDKEQKQRMLSEGAIPLEEINNLLRQIDGSLLLNQVQSAQRAMESFSELEKLLYQHLGINAPPSSRISDSLSDCHKLLKKAYEQVFGRAPTVDDRKIEPSDSSAAGNYLVENNASGDNVEEASDAQLSISLTINNRHQALQQLLLVSEYFKHHEPQSPLPNMIKRVVDWAKLPWPDLMEKLLDNSSGLEQVYQLTGVDKAE